MISRFVKICPTCQVRRGGSRLTPPSSHRSSPQITTADNSPLLFSASDSKRGSTTDHHSRRDGFVPLQGQGGWPLSSHQLHSPLGMNHVTIGSLSPASTQTASNPTTIGSLGGAFSMPSNHLDYGSGYMGSHSVRGPPY